MQAMDLLLLPVLLPLLLAQHRPHEVHSGQRHEGHQDLCNPDGAGSGCLRHLCHDPGWQRLGGQDTVYCWSLHGIPYNSHEYEQMSGNTGLRPSSDNNLSTLLADHTASVCLVLLASTLLAPLQPPLPPLSCLGVCLTLVPCC